MSVKPVFKKVLQVGMVVKDLEASVQRYTEVFGIGPWAFYTMDKSNMLNTRLRGKPAEFSMKVAFADLGGMQLELIEPLDENIYAEFLREHGEGLHHLACAVDNFHETKSYLQSKGIGALQEGVTTSGMGYAYLDTGDAMACITEIYDIPPDLQVPPPEKTYP